ncbi:DNA-formamidopyrimidine glycosylase family protein [Candidatus Villigracilis affinis]|uniref:DNA-formamidopyrimidine glycosylase family protein n=1 Tax=Candidatus Villigracilis affinis TaxID=3140682 RepID=UPI0031EA23EA
MPELPEVETFARALKPELVGKTILSADLHWARTLATPSPAQFKKQVIGQEIMDVSRRAKYLVIRLKDYNLLIHLRMSGDLVIRKGKIKPEKHDRLLLHLSNGESLAFNDTRKFGRVWLTDQPEKVLGKLGPEPLEKEFTARWLLENLHTRKRQFENHCFSIKPSLRVSATFTQMNACTSQNFIHSHYQIPLRRNKPTHCIRQFAPCLEKASATTAPA